jgi:hypothetical protein
LKNPNHGLINDSEDGRGLGYGGGHKGRSKDFDGEVAQTSNGSKKGVNSKALNPKIGLSEDQGHRA